MPVLTLSMIVKNEEKHLRDCLESIKGIADELIVVDTGSTDKTVEIAEAFGAKVFHFNWIGDFSAARNFALSKSTGNWILYLDADERISHTSKKELKKLTESTKSEGVFCTVLSVDDVGGRPNKMRYVRLFRNNPALRFCGRVHEQIEDSMKLLNYKFLNSGIEIIHVGYNITKKELQGKAKRNLDLLLADFNDSNSSYTAFQLAQSFAILSDMENAVKYFNIALQAPKLAPFYKVHCYRFIAAYELERHNLTSALQNIQLGLKTDPNPPLLNLVAAKIYQRMGDAKQADYFCRKAYENNSRLLQQSNNSNFDIMVKEEILLYFGMKVSLTINNQDSFKYYFTKLAQLFSIENSVIKKDELHLFNKLLANSGSFTILENVAEIINQDNHEILLLLIQNLRDRPQALEMLKRFPPAFSDNANFQNQFALLLAENNFTEEAITVLENLLNSPGSDPASLFYLAGIYAKCGRIKEIDRLVKTGETQFGHIPEVLARLQILKQKIAPYIK